MRSAQAQAAQAKASLTMAEVNLQKTIITVADQRDRDRPLGGRRARPWRPASRRRRCSRLRPTSARCRSRRTSTSRIWGTSARVSSSASGWTRIRPATFTGKVAQIRLDPVVAQNVVTYAAIISAPNPALELKPGMTANVTIEVGRRDNVLRVPSAALRFRPTEAALTALGQDKILAARRRRALPVPPNRALVSSICSTGSCTRPR